VTFFLLGDPQIYYPPVTVHINEPSGYGYTSVVRLSWTINRVGWYKRSLGVVFTRLVSLEGIKEGPRRGTLSGNLAVASVWKPSGKTTHNGDQRAGGGIRTHHRTSCSTPGLQAWHFLWINDFRKEPNRKLSLVIIHGIEGSGLRRPKHISLFCCINFS